jgi:hypothetical protein
LFRGKLLTEKGEFHAGGRARFINWSEKAAAKPGTMTLPRVGEVVRITKVVHTSTGTYLYWESGEEYNGVHGGLLEQEFDQA